MQKHARSKCVPPGCALTSCGLPHQLRKSYVDKIVAVCEPDYYMAREAVARAVERKTVFNMIHNDSIIKVDCIVRKDSEYRRAEFARRKQVVISDFSTWIVGKEDLIISKLDWAKDSRSEVQLRDIKNLIASGYDANYINEWTSKLGLHELWSRVQS